MNRLSILLLIGLAGLLASCGSSVTSSTQPSKYDVYSVAVSPDRVTLNAGDWSSISAIVYVSNQNTTEKPVVPAPVVKFYSSDTRVTVSPTGQVCAGQWDARYLNCVPTVVPPFTNTVNPSTGVTTTTPNANAGQPDLPSGVVTITALDAAHDVSGSTQVTLHVRAAGITLKAPTWGATTNCISQDQQIKYDAYPVDSSGNAIANVFDNDYTWSVADGSVASVSLYGYVAARNPGVTSVFAKLNGTISAPIAFVTCPPAGIVLASSAYTKGAAVPPYSTADLDSLSNGSLEYLSIAQQVDSNGNKMSLVDINGQPLNSLQFGYLSSNLLTGTFTSVQPMTALFTATSSGRTTLMASCAPNTCNASASDFTSPATNQQVSARSVGFGYPIYSNVVGATVTGTTASTVLVTGTTFADSATPVHRLLTFDSESLTLTHTIELANLPNSLVVAPNGLTAYVGSSDGLMVINLSSYQSLLKAFPIVGGLSTDVVTGAVIGVSPDSRYVVLSDVANGLVFLIDTVTAKNAVRFMLPNITAVTFADDGSNMWIAGKSGVYVYNTDAFVQTLTNASTNVQALAWTPDGQSYFASGDQLNNYSTCDDGYQTPPLPQKVQLNIGPAPINLSATAINGVPRVVGFGASPKQWIDYSVTSSSQAGNTTPVGNVCLSTVKVNTPFTAPSALQCTASQVTFSPTLEQAFVTGVNTSCASPENVIHGYDLNKQQEITLALSTTSTPSFTPVPVAPLSGGVLNDGRKLYIGTLDATNHALLRRFDLAAGTEDVVTVQQDVLDPVTNQPVIDPTTGLAETTTVTTIPASVELVPSFVAVVPK